MSSKLLIGPLEFTYEVQAISQQEVKAVQPVDASRSSATFLVESGDTYERVQITLLFTGLTEINDKLRRLIALFRVCPITSLKNEQISSFWKIESSSKLEEYIPVSLESITLTTVPDIPTAIQVFLSATKVDVSMCSGESYLSYKDEQGNLVQNPTKAFWLNKWIDQLVNTGKIPTVSQKDFNLIDIEWYGKDFVGDILQPEKSAKETIIVSNLEPLTIGYPNGHTKCLGLSSTVRNLFGFSKLLGKGTQYAQHMGSSARTISMELSFDLTTLKGKQEYDKFINFKITADKFVRSIDRIDRIIGWNIRNPISKLLAFPAGIQNTIKRDIGDGVYTPLQAVFTNTDTPGLKQCTTSLAETSTTYPRYQEVVLVSGGSDYDTMNKFFFYKAKKEYEFRKKFIGLTTDTNYDDLVAPENSDLLSSFQSFWPVDTNYAYDLLSFNYTSTFGYLNSDTLKATLLSNSLDDSEGGNKLRRLIQNHWQASGAFRVDTTAPKGWTRYRINAEALWDSINGNISSDFLSDTEGPNVYTEIQKTIEDYLLNRVINSSNLSEQEINLIKLAAGKLVVGFFGDYERLLDFSSNTGEVVAFLSKQKFEFREVFLRSLFSVIVERAPQPRFLEHTYSNDGIQEAFFKLIVDYKESQSLLDELQDVGRDPIYQNKSLLFKKSNFQDIPLPTYRELFGDDWETFAPTYDDLGISNTITDPSLAYASLEEVQSTIAVEETDSVHPSVWFFNKRMKNIDGKNMRQLALSSGTIGTRVNQAMTINIPYDQDSLEQIKNLLEEQEYGQVTPERRQSIKENLSTLLYRGFQESAVTNKNHEADLLNIYEQFGKDPTSEENKGKPIRLYVSYSGNNLSRREVSFPGLGGELYRVASENFIIRPTDALPHIDTDSAMKSSLEPSFEFIRNLEQSTKETIQSSISQIPDDYNNYVKLFPAVKVYLVDERGKDLIADDTFFDINPIVSLDISMDKDDADLAVIQIADPLYNLQSSMFTATNTENTSIEGEKKRAVLQTINGLDTTTYLSRYKIAQGRGIVIKIGYDSMPKNLTTIFTGRISEIVPGDILSIVCQSWKSELISRQVSFYNDDPNSWGARDLAIQAIVKADPKGFGDFFAEKDANYLLRNLDPLDVDSLRNKVEAITRSINIEGRGTRTITEDILNWIGTSVGFGSIAKRNNGLDTRLKNIWYPDAPNHSNFLGLRSKVGVMPSYLNDSWIVPLQPCWEVLKEASRHAWNCIVQVVPYDGRATLFMGSPDQPYYFTEGNPFVMRAWRVRQNAKREKNTQIFSESLSSFINSEFNVANNSLEEEQFISELTDTLLKQLNNQLKSEGKPYPSFETAVHTAFYKTKATNNIFTTLDFENQNENITRLTRNGKLFTLKSCFSLIKKMLSFNFFSNDGVPEVTKLSIEKSRLPLEIYRNVKNSVGGDITALFFISTYFQVPMTSIPLSWIDHRRDIEVLLGDITQLTDVQLDGLLPPYDSRSILDLVREKAGKLDIMQGSTTEILFPVFTSSKDELLGNLRSLKEILRIDLPKSLSTRNTDIDNKISSFVNYIDKNILVTPSTDVNQRVLIKYSIRKHFEDLLTYLENGNPTPLGQEWSSTSLRDRVKEHLVEFKAFVYFFGSFLLQDTDTQQKFSQVIGRNDRSFPPNMQVFRVHHWVDDERDIIQNNIIASTKEMWNTVVIEHPAKGEIDDIVEGPDSVYSLQKISSAVKWNYYPKNEVTGVYGLQFHPGLTLANKKLKICTELNCYTPELAAKLSLTHLADGARRMYRGSLVIRGRVIKPHDRVCLRDSYTNMSGPIEVESVVHHWSPDTGWITNIVPQAIAEANAGASILQTAAMEAVFNIVFNSIEFAADVATIAVIIATLGAAAGAVSGAEAAAISAKNFAVKDGIAAGLRTIGEKGALGAAGQAGKASLAIGGDLLSTLLSGQTFKSPFVTLGKLYAKLGGPALAFGKIYTTEAISNTVSHQFFKMMVVESFIQSALQLEKLPVILSPLMFEGRPFLAGLETDAPIWNVFANDIFYNIRTMNYGAEKVLESLRDFIGLPLDSAGKFK